MMNLFEPLSPCGSWMLDTSCPKSLMLTAFLALVFSVIALGSVLGLRARRHTHPDNPSTVYAQRALRRTKRLLHGNRAPSYPLEVLLISGGGCSKPVTVTLDDGEGGPSQLVTISPYNTATVVVYTRGDIKFSFAGQAIQPSTIRYSQLPSEAKPLNNDLIAAAKSVSILRVNFECSGAGFSFPSSVLIKGVRIV